MSYCALIIYSSVTNNTQQVAFALGDTFMEYGISVNYARVLPQNPQDTPMKYYPEDYDFLAVGCPVTASLPSMDFMAALGSQEDYRPRRTRFLRRESRENKNRYGIAFTTYGGTADGPEECLATLEVEKAYLGVYGFTPVGEFACCGRELRHNSVEELGGLLNMTEAEAKALMSLYKENPESPEFRQMPPKLREAVKGLAALRQDSKSEPVGDPLGIGRPGQTFWHYDMQNRPGSRDLDKCRCFLMNILEDYLLTLDGNSRTPGPVYKSIC